MKKKLPVKIPDIIIILLSAGLTVFSGFVAYARTDATLQLFIQGPTQRWVFPLEGTEQTVRVRGILNDDTVVRISGGEVWAESSPCDNQTCVNMGRMNADSWWPWVACLPNNVMFVIEGQDEHRATDGAVW